MNKLSTIREPFIIVLIGLPASGKSTWTSQFLDAYSESFERKIEYVSLDKWIEDKARQNGVTYTEEFKGSVGWATSKLKAESRDAIKSVNNIIWDQTNLTKKKRRGILKKIPDCYFKIAVDFDVTDAVLNERLERRAKEEGKFIPKHVIDKMASSYNPVSKEEGFDIIIKVR